MLDKHAFQSTILYWLYNYFFTYQKNYFYLFHLVECHLLDAYILDFQQVI